MGTGDGLDVYMVLPTEVNPFARKDWERVEKRLVHVDHVRGMESAMALAAEHAVANNMGDGDYCVFDRSGRRLLAHVRVREGSPLAHVADDAAMRPATAQPDTPPGTPGEDASREVCHCGSRWLVLNPCDTCGRRRCGTCLTSRVCCKYGGRAHPLQTPQEE